MFMIHPDSDFAFYSLFFVQNWGTETPGEIYIVSINSSELIMWAIQKSSGHVHSRGE